MNFSCVSVLTLLKEFPINSGTGVLLEGARGTAVNAPDSEGTTVNAARSVCCLFGGRVESVASMVKAENELCNDWTPPDRVDSGRERQFRLEPRKWGFLDALTTGTTGCGVSMFLSRGGSAENETCRLGPDLSRDLVRFRELRPDFRFH